MHGFWTMPKNTEKTRRCARLGSKLTDAGRHGSGAADESRPELHDRRSNSLSPSCRKARNNYPTDQRPAGLVQNAPGRPTGIASLNSMTTGSSPDQFERTTQIADRPTPDRPPRR